ncbi:hypothetical protein PMZ80_003084 [Knufia obscura]|uniref:Regulatory P domain-containing protein n=2 Tax=Knufia TaxID=430999 RepID=A0AAN8I129_9EURO|nr:hypothetical protein PMZ80_003084 [Knufia obscura]KAK5947897.1 hypothetical protein OHC33_011054 [Knufia fluminis]
MKVNNFLTASLVAATTVAGAKINNAAKMEGMMELKEQQWSAAAQRGVFGGSKMYKKKTSVERCINGRAGEYQCKNIDMHAFLSHEDLGSEDLRGNDIWGWTSPDGREFGIVGQTDGVAFVEINTKTGGLTYLGRLPTQTTVVSWRDIKVIGHHAYIGSEAEGHGLQIFDLTKLLGDGRPSWRKPREPVLYSIDSDLTAWYSGFGASHNLVAHESTNMIYAVGGRSGANARNTTCAGGMFMVDVSDPANPTSPGCVSQDGYVHDAQCVIYTGPTAQYHGREICFNYNEDTLTIMDLTDKSVPIVISTTPYVGNEYTHQGWLTDASMTFLLLDDELDEMGGVGPSSGNNRTTTYIFDVSDLAAPVNTGFYQSPAKSIDHNQYVIAGLSYQANYGSGLRVIDVSGLKQDPTGGNIEETGFFDCHPEDDDVNGVVEFLGTWSVYPYYESGYMLLNSIERGVFSLKYNGRGKAY